MKITFVEINQETGKLIQRAICDNDRYSVDVHCGDFVEYATKLKKDEKRFIIVSPANSFGMMDGGFDEAIRQFYQEACKRDIVSFVQTEIGIEYGGEQPVGTCLRIGSPFDKSIPMLYHIPTMRFPMDVSGTNNAYMAMKALLLQLDKDDEEFQLYDNVDEVLVPVFCTGYGHMSPYQAVGQMKLAWNRFADNSFSPNISSWEKIGEEVRNQILAGTEVEMCRKGEF